MTRSGGSGECPDEDHEVAALRDKVKLLLNKNEKLLEEKHQLTVLHLAREDQDERELLLLKEQNDQLKDKLKAEAADWEMQKGKLLGEVASCGSKWTTWLAAGYVQRRNADANATQ